MENYLMGLLGILVSVGLFALGYHRTVGAKRERVRLANDSIVRILLRQVSSENYTPQSADIQRLVDSKARQFRVRPDELLPRDCLLNDVFVQITETEFLPQEKRSEILVRLEGAEEERSAEPGLRGADRFAEGPSLRRRQRETDVLAVAMGVLASLVGALSVSLPKIFTTIDGVGKTLPLFLSVTAAGLITILLLLVYYRLRRQQETSDRGTVTRSAFELERDVAQVLEKGGASVQIAGQGDQGFDFAFGQADKRILVEVKGWNQPVPYRILGRSLEQLSAAVASQGADEGILVLPNSARSMPAPAGIGNVKIMTVRQFRNYVVHSSRG